MVTSGTIDGVIISTVTRNGGEMGMLSVLDAIFPILILYLDTWAVSKIQYILHDVCLLNLSGLFCTCTCIAYTYVIGSMNCINNTTFN